MQLNLTTTHPTQRPLAILVSISIIVFTWSQKIILIYSFSLHLLICLRLIGLLHMQFLK